jgi:hypothetical protein
MNFAIDGQDRGHCVEAETGRGGANAMTPRRTHWSMLIGGALLAWGAAARAQDAAAPRRAEGRPADAQDPEARRAERLRVRGLPTTPVVLLQAPAVAEELALTDAQRERIADIGRDFDARRGAFAASLSQRGRPLDANQLVTRVNAVRAEQEAELARVLDARQRTRLAQIALQIEGPRAVLRPDVAARLQLSDDQIADLQVVLDTMRATQDQLWEARLEQLNAPPMPQPTPKAKGAAPAPKDAPPVAAPPDPIALVHEEQLRVEDAAVRQIGRILTRRQKATFDRLLGEPFALERIRPAPAPTLPPPGADEAPILEPIPREDGPPGSSS